MRHRCSCVSGCDYPLLLRKKYEGAQRSGDCYWYDRCIAGCSSSLFCCVAAVSKTVCNNVFLCDLLGRMLFAAGNQALLEGWTDLNGPRYQMEALYEVLHGDYSAPRLTVIHDFTAHFPFYYNENGEISQGLKNMDLPDYYPQHMYCAKVLLNMIDMILEADPDAVIVIQADHGLHGNVEEDFKAAFGEDADTLELWNSTMSTIRVPEMYRTGEEHYATENPLNISRYLVNSFVGKNYEYLPPN